MVAAVEIVDGVATTTLTQTLRNDGPREAEATWLLPLPEGAVADDFRMTVGGVETSGEVLAAGQARQVYESIVRRRRDPGLLEYFDRGCLRARVFPIPARGEAVVDVVFKHVLPRLGGLERWTFALGAAGIEGTAPEELVLDVRIRSQRPIRNVFSPAPGVEVLRTGDHEARATFEGGAAALSGRELAVYYGSVSYTHLTLPTIYSV